ncbi:threonine/serine exporter family protein [Clostridium sp. MT-14]|jgi:uncharacterized membrane protein YjjP (DUF1212 family)|uniref:Threonine/serine exporter family protein n=1 Tax=Clostridium aromativorans TaxID=2836848 RepID=A0ABS8N7C7_9CLOT|nr:MULTISPECIES: threonine/serine exporter family protein [Clostridium]KAA8670984.1 threonine/serine exporter family protein [Clostridium sp. HV4-5-A1G]MCC9295697.1 threonine/serine exporter family protein [Clostridium aromativorans]CAB1243215.1 Threonine/serine exporter [Clostridiaceae bacterium BL-3]
MDINRIVNLAAYAGKIMLESGAEIYRVEETIIRISKNYNIDDIDAFVTLNIIIISASDKYGQTISLIKRVRQRTLNLEKISQVNNISRHIKDEAYTLDEMENKLSKIQYSKPYSTKIIILFSGIAAAFFSLVFGGNLHDFLVSFIIGCILSILSKSLGLLQANEFFINIICGAVTALIALSSVQLEIGSHVDTIIISSIMLLVPGLSITNAIRDTMAGDLISGISRGIEAFLVAIAIAVGTGSILKLWLVLGGL